LANRGRSVPPQTSLSPRQDRSHRAHSHRLIQKGVENIKEKRNRLDAAKEACRAAGAEIEKFSLLLGRYDGVIVIEAPEAEILGELTPATGSQVPVRREFLRVSTEDE
jgi:uncharacterized protein with GYD domain